jgi:hypothetical protein
MSAMARPAQPATPLNRRYARLRIPIVLAAFPGSICAQSHPNLDALMPRAETHFPSEWWKIYHHRWKKISDTSDTVFQLP